MKATKLSKLQRWILTRAAESPDACTSNQPRDLIAARVLAEFYGVPLKRDRIKWGEHNFDLACIDRRRYDACKAATSKAFARLCARGLAVQHQYGTLKLTEAGTAATGLQVDILPTCKPLQTGKGIA